MFKQTNIFKDPGLGKLEKKKVERMRKEGYVCLVCGRKGKRDIFRKLPFRPIRALLYF